MIHARRAKEPSRFDAANCVRAATAMSADFQDCVAVSARRIEALCKPDVSTMAAVETVDRNLGRGRGRVKRIVLKKQPVTALLVCGENARLRLEINGVASLHLHSTGAGGVKTLEDGGVVAGHDEARR
jgi:hypothetical protein